MSLPPKPIGSGTVPPRSDDPEREFESAIERVQRRETAAPRKGFDEERQHEEQPHAPDDAEEGVEEAAPLPGAIPTGLWTPFSDD